jgi:ATP-dependent helicase/nuclease subunit B
LSPSLFDTPAPRLFTLPPQADFLRAIAQTLRTEFNADENPDALARLLVLTPTRRAARALGDAFADLAGSGVAILPMIRPIGDVDVDDPPFEPGELADIAPPAISTARRRFELARLILAKEASLGRPIGLGGALSLADPLAALLDDLATEGVSDLDGLDGDIREHLPQDRQEAAAFLSIIREIWPARLVELGVMDPAARRSRVLEALVERWRETPPDHPVLIVGATGSIPAACEVMRIVANLPHGAVVLPGFDWDADEAAWAHIDDAHPQWAMKGFVEQLGVERGGVEQWPAFAEPLPARARRRVIAEALRPAETTDDWLSRIRTLDQELGADFFATGLDGLSLIEADDSLTEARVCALLLREILDQPDKTAILVTPDRNLARRISAEMTRFGVRLDDSGGGSLAASPVAALLTRILDLTDEPGSAVALSALWNSPWFTMGDTRGRVHTALGKFEAEALRGARPGPDMRSVIARMDGKYVDLFDDDKALITSVLLALDEAIAPMLTGEVRPAAHWAEAHARAAEAIAATDASDGNRLWQGSDGEAAANVMREWLTESGALPEMTLRDYAAAFRTTLATRRVPPSRGVHPRLQMLGPMEARLIHADRIVLAGLNEGVWPAGLGADPWLSRGMRKAVGLGAPERRYGLAAHDFAQLAAGRDVYLTRSAKVDGAPSVASRWIWRLKTLADGALDADRARDLLAAPIDYPALARKLDAPSGPPRPVGKPSPRPPVSARPRGLSITEIRTWVRDPYSIYARRILGIEPLDPADMVPGPRERGTALHQALHTVFEGWGKTLPDTAETELVEEGRRQLILAGFAPAELVIELPRFARAARWLITWEKQRRAEGHVIDELEIKGELTLDGPAGPWVLRGRADRFDRHPDGRLDIIDYKTGTCPTAKIVNAGFDPQLPLTAAMARQAGVFEKLQAEAPAGLYYVRLPGNSSGGNEVRIDEQRSTGTAAEMADQAIDELRQWITHFDDEMTPYLSQPRAQYTNDYGQYDQLARRGEWASAGEGEVEND